MLCATQAMFQGASSFDRDVNAWNVGQVTHMGVRCGLGVAAGEGLPCRPHFACAGRWRGAICAWVGGALVHGRQQRAVHASAAAASARGARAGLTRGALCATQRMFRGASSFDRDVNAWNVGQVTSMDVRRALGVAVGEGHAAPSALCSRGPVAWCHVLGWEGRLCMGGSIAAEHASAAASAAHGTHAGLTRGAVRYAEHVYSRELL